MNRRRTTQTYTISRYTITTVYIKKKKYNRQSDLRALIRVWTDRATSLHRTKKINTQVRVSVKKNLLSARLYFYIYTTHGNCDGRVGSSFYSGSKIRSTLLLALVALPAYAAIGRQLFPFTFRTYAPVSLINRTNVRYVYCYYYYNIYTPHIYTYLSLCT